VGIHWVGHGDDHATRVRIDSRRAQETRGCGLIDTKISWAHATWNPFASCTPAATISMPTLSDGAVMHGESDSRLPGCQLHAALNAAGTNRWMPPDVLERQVATPDECLRCYKWDQYGALESRSRAIIFLTIFIWWRLGGSGLEFSITRQRRIKKFSQRIRTAVRAVPQGSSKCLPNLSIRSRKQGRESVAGGQSATIL